MRHPCPRSFARGRSPVASSRFSWMLAYEDIRWAVGRFPMQRMCLCSRPDGAPVLLPHRPSELGSESYARRRLKADGRLAIGVFQGRPGSIASCVWKSGAWGRSGPLEGAGLDRDQEVLRFSRPPDPPLASILRLRGRLLSPKSRQACRAEGRVAAAATGSPRRRKVDQTDAAAKDGRGAVRAAGWALDLGLREGAIG